jgi:hypothetical protein
MSSSHRIRRSIGVLANLQRTAASAPAVIRCSYHAPQRRDSSVSEAMTMSLADNLLQKQQKQQEQVAAVAIPYAFPYAYWQRGNGPRFDGGLVNR